jgi:hypothetical protein
MGNEKIWESIKVDINKYGFFFWFLLFGFTEIVFSIIYRPEYIQLGFLSICLGLICYSIDSLIDRITQQLFIDKYPDEEKKKRVPLWMYIIRFIIHGLLFVGFFFLINSKYHFI